jgi:DNA-directed RNA polymerase subunit beta'
LDNHNVVIGSVIAAADKGKVERRYPVQWTRTTPIISEKAGEVKFHDIIEGVTMKEEVDQLTGQVAIVIVEHKEEHPRAFSTSMGNQPPITPSAREEWCGR